MTSLPAFRIAAAVGIVITVFPFPATAQAPPEFTTIGLLTNREVRLEYNVSEGPLYRLLVSTNFQSWLPAFTAVPTASSLQYTDTAAPFLPVRAYRLARLSETNLPTGDHLATTNGDVVIHPLYHASLVLQWNGLTLYNDPDDDPAYDVRYQGLPKADLILVSHSHGDHYSAGKIQSLGGSNAIVVVPQAVYSQLPAALRPAAVVLGSNAVTNLLGITIQAVPAYNSNHPPGSGNGYVLGIGGRRIYLSGDTGNTAEMRALTDIDVAFLCMNTPFTMTVNEATNAVRAFQPRVVYPYHYRNQNGTTTNAAHFKRQLGQDLGIEVRLRPWY